MKKKKVNSNKKEWMKEKWKEKLGWKKYRKAKNENEKKINYGKESNVDGK